jgi:predicted RNA-binding protein with RPS1 domain
MVYAKIEEGILERDINGCIRIPEIKFTEAEVKDIQEALYMICKVNVKIIQLKDTFKENDRKQKKGEIND